MIRSVFTNGLRVLCFIAFYLLFATLVFAGTDKYTAFNVKVTGKGQPMLFIPGATCSGDEWNETVTRYGSQYQCHVFTLAGYAGVTPLASGPYLETMKKQIEQYITDQKLDNVILFGHSIGGFLSLCIASEMQTHLQKIVVVDALPFFALTFNPNAPDTFSESKTLIMLDRYNKIDEKRRMEMQMATSKHMCADSTKWDMITSWGMQSDRKTLVYTMAEMLVCDIRKKISAIHVPVLIMAAYCKNDAEPDFNRKTVLDTFSLQYVACTTCTIHVTEDGVKHFIMYDAPDWYFKEIDNFVKN